MHLKILMTTMGKSLSWKVCPKTPEQSPEPPIAHDMRKLNTRRDLQHIIVFEYSLVLVTN